MTTDQAPPVPAAEFDEIVDALAARQHERMTRSTTSYAELNAADQRACRALVEPVVRDLFTWQSTGGWES